MDTPPTLITVLFILVGGFALFALGYSLRARRVEKRRRADDQARAGALRAESELALALHGARLEAVLQAIDGGVVVLDADQRLTNLNPSAEGMLGLVSAQVRGRLIQEVVRQPELNRCIAAALTGEPSEAEIDLLGEAPRCVRVAHHVLHDARGNRAGLILILTDLTRLRRLETVRTDFASNVSHELRTPITNIKGYVETLLDPAVAADAARLDQFLRIIARNADRLIAIVEDMLMLAQLERPEARETLAVQHARIAPIIESVVASLGPEAGAKSVSLEHEAPDDLSAMINPPLMEQAVSNLVANAVRYSPAGATVRIQASMRASVEIEVMDNGPGIAEEHLGRIFERFYRVDRDRGRERGGTGLGLAIVKHIMNLHGGQVRVDTALGKGSRFTLILPNA